MARTIRLAAETDATQILDIYDPIVRDTAISFEDVPPSRPEMAGRIRDTLLFHPWLVCEEAGSVLGYAYASRFRTRPAYQWAVEVTAYVRPEARARGVGRALYTSLLEILRIQGFTSALAVITLPNEASVALHERLGFKRVGVFRGAGYKLMAWHDVGWWALHIQDPSGAPEAPRPVADVWAAAVAFMEARQ